MGLKNINRLIILLVLSFLIVLGWGDQANSQQLAEKLYLAHQGDQPLPSPLIAQYLKQQDKLTTTVVNYGSHQGYLALPEDRTTPLPGLIVIHEWWGLNDNIKAATRRLAEAGYVVLAVDLYDGKVATTPEEAKALVSAALKKPELLEANLRAAYDYLKTEQQVSKVGSIGWCFGGTWSLNTALLLPEQLGATVIYYGGGIETESDKLAPLQMPILGIFGALDQNPSVETVRRFQAVLTSQGKDVEIYIYPDVGHAFANPSGTNYNPEAAEDAWSKTLAFLAKHLQNP